MLKIRKKSTTPVDKVKVVGGEQKNFKWFKDQKLIGTIVLIAAVVFQIFAFLPVPFFTTIHSYTVGMLFGWYNPFFYFFVIYKATVMIFGDKIKLPKWVKLNGLTYWIVAVSITFIGVATGYYQTKNEWTSIGGKSFKAFNIWFDDFRHNATYGAWTPANTNGGVVGVFLYSLFGSVSSGIGAFIIAILALVTTFSYIVTGSSYSFYKNLINKRKITLQQKEIKTEEESEKVEKLLKEVPKTKYDDIEDPFLEKPKPTFEEKLKEPEKKETTKTVDFPFDDPFDV